MTMERILSCRLGLDVVSEETQLPAGAVRAADNVVLGKSGSIKRRGGYDQAQAVTGAHSLWRGKINAVTLFIANGTLYKLNEGGTTKTALATGLVGSRAYYEEYGTSIYVSCGILLRLDTDGVIRVPGIVSLLGNQPVLTAAANGGLTPGQYGVAYSAVNDLGEESGLSDTAFITLDATKGTINVALPALPSGASYWRIYRTTADGDELYLAALSTTTAKALTFGELSRKERTYMHAPMPAGGQLSNYNGRMYSPVGSVLCYSPSFNPNLTSARDGFIPFPDSVDMVLGLNSGLYVGTPTTVYWLGGGGPNDFTMNVAVDNGVIAGSGALVDATMFDLGIPSLNPVAVWLSPHGYQIGLDGGKVLSPQKDRIILEALQANTHAFTRNGIKQLITSADSMSLGAGGATDSIA